MDGLVYPPVLPPEYSFRQKQRPKGRGVVLKKTKVGLVFRGTRAAVGRTVGVSGIPRQPDAPPFLSPSRWMEFVCQEGFQGGGSPLFPSPPGPVISFPLPRSSCRLLVLCVFVLAVVVLLAFVFGLVAFSRLVLRLVLVLGLHASSMRSSAWEEEEGPEARGRRKHENGNTTRKLKTRRTLYRKCGEVQRQH